MDLAMHGFRVCKQFAWRAPDLKELADASTRGAALGLTDDEIAFYDVQATNDSAVQAMGDVKLKVIATELISQVKKSVPIEWSVRTSCPVALAREAGGVA